MRGSDSRGGARQTAVARPRKALFDEHGRREAAVKFLETDSHRTVGGALYQVDRNLTKRAR